MIKAEIISHEGNPGPNWLERCRTIITPTNVSSLVIIVAIAGLSFVVLNRDSNEQAAAANQPVTFSKPLKVEPSDSQTYQAADGSTTVQAAPTEETTSDESGQVTGTDDAAASALNNTGTTPDANSNDQSGFNGQGNLRSRSLTNKVQSTLPVVDETLNKVKNLLN